MSVRYIRKEKEFQGLIDLLDSLAQDYGEFLAYFVGLKEDKYSLEYIYGHVFLFKAYFERTLEGLQHTLIRYPLIERVNSHLQNLFRQKEILNNRLQDFIESCSRGKVNREKLRHAADLSERNINTEQYRGLMRLKRKRDIDSSNILSALMAIDDLRLYLNERKSLGLQSAFHLERDQEDLEEEFSRIESMLKNNISIFTEFRDEIYAYRKRFLILQDEKYPWWYPEKMTYKDAICRSYHELTEL